MTVCAGTSRAGGHKPSTGDAQAESNSNPERTIATEMTWLVGCTRVVMACP